MGADADLLGRVVPELELVLGMGPGTPGWAARGRSRR